jgi:hypothetical protein
MMQDADAYKPPSNTTRELPLIDTRQIDDVSRSKIVNYFCASP